MNLHAGELYEYGLGLGGLHCSLMLHLPEKYSMLGHSLHTAFEYYEKASRMK